MLLTAALLSVLVQGTAPKVELPPPVQAGLAALEEGRCDAAFVHWSRPAAPGTPTGAPQRLTDCATLKRLGALHGHDVLRVVGIGDRIRRIYVVLRYDTQPVYLLLIAYQPDAEWVVIKSNWNVSADRVLPPDMVPPERATRP